LQGKNRVGWIDEKRYFYDLGHNHNTLPSFHPTNLPYNLVTK